MKVIKKIFIGILAMFSLLCIENVKAVDLKDKEKVKIYILAGSKDDIINNVVMDDGKSLKDYEGSVEIINQSSMIPFSVEFRSYSQIGSFFDYAAWINRDGYDTLSLKPKSNVRNSVSARDMAWNLLSSKRGLGYHKGFDKEKSLRNQYNCHFEFAKSKEYWNLESHRPEVNWLTMILKGCNP